MSDLKNTVMTHPAAIVTRANVLTLDTASLMGIARDRALDPTAFDDNDPFFFPAEISSSRLDAYFSRMQQSSLKNYANEADSGVSFMLAHQTRGTMPVGSSLTGSYIGAQGNGVARVQAAFFTLPGFDGGIISTDQLIRGIRTGMYRDVSIGFYGGDAICSICDRDVYGWFTDCPHIPGVEYDISDTKGNVLGRELCVANIEDAHLAEVSGVYDGATPGAAILKAQMVADAGRLSPMTARMLEQRYRHLDRSVLRAIHDAGLSKIAVTAPLENTAPGEDRSASSDPGSEVSGPNEAASTQREETQMAGEDGANNGNREATTAGANENERRDLGAVATGAVAYSDRTNRTEGTNGTDGTGAPSETGTAHQDPQQQPSPQQLETVRLIVRESGVAGEFASVEEAVRALAGEVVRLRPLADDGTSYRQSLLEATLREAVRAGFGEEMYRGVLSRATVDELRSMLAGFGVTGDAIFREGRQSVDEGEVEPPVNAVTGRTPSEAYSI